MATRRSAVDWTKLVEGWRRSGLGAREFADRARISVEQLRWWKWHLGKSRVDAASKRRGAEMVRVEIRPPRSRRVVDTPPSVIEIARGDWVVRVARGVDVPTLEHVLDVIASRAAC
jgi:hypothetical protein